MPTVGHPSWCDSSRCEFTLGGRHQSSTRTVQLARNAPPRVLLLLVQAPHDPAKIRMVTISEHVINQMDMQLDEGHLLQATLAQLLDETKPPEHTGGTPTP